MMNAGTRLPGIPNPTSWWTGHGNLQLAGDVFGDAHGPSVVLLHGAGQTRHAWQGVGERLANSGYRVITFDARGHGDSEWDPAGDYDLALMVQDLRRVLEAIGVHRPALVGASMGGLASLFAMGNQIVDACALVLVDVVPTVNDEGRENVKLFMSRNPQGFASLEEVADAIAAYQPHRKRKRKLDGLAKNVRLASNGRYFWHWDPRLGEQTEAMPERERALRACAANLTAPALLIRGALSDIVNDAGAQEFLQLCPHSEYVNVADASHMVAGDRNDIFGDALIEFLDRVTKG
jgi:pimeloyl-ACP methyl ester carboxylesterase